MSQLVVGGGHGKTGGSQTHFQRRCCRHGWQRVSFVDATDLRNMEITKADFSRLSIFALDDSPFVRRLLEELLKSFGVGDIFTAATADALFAEMKRRTPDIVFCDWQMYPIDGLDVLHLRIPFIMLTGHNGTEDVQTAIGEGADSYVVKPFSAETIMKHLLKVIARDKGALAEEEVWTVD